MILQSQQVRIDTFVQNRQGHIEFSFSTIEEKYNIKAS